MIGRGRTHTYRVLVFVIGALLAGSLVACGRGATDGGPKAGPTAGGLSPIAPTAPGTGRASTTTARAADDVSTATATTAPATVGLVRLRPNHWPVGSQIGPVLEHEWHMRTPALATYGPGATPPVTTSTGSSPMIAVWVTRGNASGLFESSAFMVFARATDTIDVNGNEAVLAPFGDGSLYWIEPDGARVVVSGVGLSTEQLVAAARSLRVTESGPEIPAAALPAGWVLTEQEADRDVVLHTTSFDFSVTAHAGSTRYTRLVISEERPAGGPTAVPERPAAAADQGADRWSRATVRRQGDGFVTADWAERAGVHVMASGSEEGELRRVVNGLEAVDEPAWELFRQVASRQATATPPASMTTDTIGVPALSDDTVWTWIQRGREIAFGHCVASMTTSPDPLEVAIQLPPYQAARGFSEIEALTEEQRTIPCPP